MVICCFTSLENYEVFFLNEALEDCPVDIRNAFISRDPAVLKGALLVYPEFKGVKFFVADVYTNSIMEWLAGWMWINYLSSKIRCRFDGNYHFMCN